MLHYLSRFFGVYLLATASWAIAFTQEEKAARLQQLSPLQYAVTQKKATERPFANAYWANQKEGIYVDIVSGEPLFSSTDKYKSGTGWPSFTQAIEAHHLILSKERSWLGLMRIEVKSKLARSHLGHVFNDGPKPHGKRYCINSAALKFIPKEKMKALGYGNYLFLFSLKPKKE